MFLVRLIVMERNGRTLQRLGRGLRLVMGSFVVRPLESRVDKPVGDIQVAVDELVGRPGNVIVQMNRDSSTGADRGSIVTTSPRFEAIVVLLVALVALVVSVACAGNVVQGDARASTFFALTWGIGWFALTIYRLWLQGGALEDAEEALERAVGPANLRWSASRPKMKDRTGRAER